MKKLILSLAAIGSLMVATTACNSTRNASETRDSTMMDSTTNTTVMDTATTPMTTDTAKMTMPADTMKMTPPM